MLFRSPEVARGYIEKLGKLRIKFLAEKVETQEQFDEYLAMGCEYFQGYFFSRPKIVKGKRIGASQVSMISAIGPVITIYFGWLILNEPITPVQIAGAVLVLAGVLLVSLKVEAPASRP